MSLRFIYGRAGSGKSNYCLQDIKEKIKKGCSGPLIMIVPEQFSFQAEKNLLRTIGPSGIANAQVLSFSRMAYRVLNEVGGITRQHMNSAGANMLMYRILEENRDKLCAFLQASRKQGFVDTASRMISELKKYEVSPEILIETKDKIQDSELRNKLNDIGILFQEFQKKLHENYIDTEDELSLLYEKMDYSKLFDGAEVWMDEFFSFTPQQNRIIEKLMLAAKRVNITLTSDPENEISDIFTLTSETENKLISMARDNNIALDRPVALSCSPCYRFKNSDDIDYLEKHLFSYPYNTFKGNVSDIGMFKAQDRYSEVIETAKNILHFCRDNGYRYNDIAVVSGDLDSYENLIRVIFSEYEIPYFIDKKREISSNPLIIYVIASVEILARNWSYESIFRYLKCGLLNIDMNEIDALENFVLANGIKGKRWTQKESWKGAKDSNQQEEEIDSINITRLKIVEPLIEFDKKLKNSKNAREMCTAIYEFLCNTQIPDRIEEWIDEFKKNEELDKINEYKQIWDVTMKVLEQIVEVMGEEEMDLDQLSKVLSIGFNSYEVGVIPPSLDQVLVGSIQRLRSHEIKILFIIGVNDGIFPAKIDGDLIFSDEDRVKLKEMGVEIAKDSRSKAFDEEFLVYTTLTTAGTYLKLSYPIADSEGKTMRPSIIISRIKKLYPNMKEKSNIISKNFEEDIELIANPRSTFRELITALRSSNEGVTLSPMWLDVYRWFSNSKAWQDKLSTILNGFYFANEAEIVDTSKIRKLYGKHLKLSVSKLESYARCPFGYFVKHGLGANERKIYKLSRPDIGTFMHEILYDFSKHIHEKNINYKEVSDDECKSILNDIIDKKVQDMQESIFTSSFRSMHSIDIMKRILTRSVWLMVRQMRMGDFIPEGYEIAFGDGSMYPPIEVKMHSGEILYLIGRVDRLDLFKEQNGEYVRIIDYKSGNKEFNLSDVYYGLQLQLLVYLDAILTDISKSLDKEVMPGGAFYFRMDDPIIRSNEELGEKELEEEIMKNLKLDGLILSDLNVVKHMDNEISGSSAIIPARVNKDDELAKNKSGVTLEQFGYLRRYVKDTIASLCEEMLEGNIELAPRKNRGDLPCKYCDLSMACQFDKRLNGNRIRNLPQKSNDEIWEILRNKYSDSDIQGSEDKI